MSEVRLIDADVLEEIVRDDIRLYDSDRTYNMFNQMKRDCLVELAERIERAPTVDAVSVVRCRDCKYCYAEGFVNVRNVCEKHYDFGNVTDDWFCADGDRISDHDKY